MVYNDGEAIAGPLMGLKHTDKVRTRRVAKSGIVLSNLKNWQLQPNSRLNISRCTWFPVAVHETELDAVWKLERGWA